MLPDWKLGANEHFWLDGPFQKGDQKKPGVPANPGETYYAFWLRSFWFLKNWFDRTQFAFLPQENFEKKLRHIEIALYHSRSFPITTPAIFPTGLISPSDGYSHLEGSTAKVVCAGKIAAKLQAVKGAFQAFKCGRLGVFLLGQEMAAKRGPELFLQTGQSQIRLGLAEWFAGS